MSSNQRGPVYFFVALIGLAFMCVCLVAVGFGATRMADQLNWPPAENSVSVAFPSPTPVAGVAAQQASVPVQAPVEITIDPALDPEPQILRAVYLKVNPSVVKVENLTTLGDGSQTDELVPQGQGSGFVWDARGDIVTNAHVVEGTDTVRVIFADDRAVTGQVLGADPNSDLAVIRIDPSGFDLTPVARGDIDQVAVGDRAIAIGAPFDFAGSMTVGTVSGLGRSIRSLNIRYTIPEVIQTDAPINPGNSGGPLLNAAGEVIGINAQIRTADGVRANSGVGFAIPVYIAERVIPALIDGGSYQHPFIGVSGQTYSPEWADALDLPKDVKGAYITEALSGYPAARAGLRGADRETSLVVGVNPMTGQPEYLRAGGDLVVGINDRPVERFDDLLIYLFRYAAPGDEVQLTVLRPGGSETVIPVTLGVRPQQ
ncbi:MAG: trypsin-like peptidase domain-containing protein [Caldilineales bacterium]